MSGTEVDVARRAASVAEELRREFIDETIENVQAMDLAIEEVKKDRKSAGELLNLIQRTILPIRGRAANHKVPLIGPIAHRIENYIEGTKSLTPETLDDLTKFVTIMSDVLDGTIPADSDASELVRRLPVKFSFNEAEVEVREIEALLVMEAGTAARFVERELNQCGYRTSLVETTFEALPLIVHTKPDLVIISAIMPDLTGIDFAIGLCAMPKTRNIPVALITSLDADDEYLALVPKKIPVIHKSARFGDDLADALDNLFII